MVYTCQYQSPMGDILLAADEIGLTGLWFVGQKYFASILPDEHIVAGNTDSCRVQKVAGCVFFR